MICYFFSELKYALIKISLVLNYFSIINQKGYVLKIEIYRIKMTNEKNFIKENMLINVLGKKKR